MRIGNVASKRDLDKEKNAKKNNKKEIRVVVDGKDVTPKSLLSSTIRRSLEVDKTESKSSVNANFNFNDSRAFGPPPELCQSSYNSSIIQASQVGGLSRSFMMGSMISSKATASLDSIASEISMDRYVRAAAKESEDDLTFEEREALTLADLKKMVFVTLSETDTIPLFEMDRVSVSINDDDAEIVQESNDSYEKLCSIREGNDTYRARGMQTFNDALKTKEMQTTNVAQHDIGVSATTYDMFDTYKAAKVAAETEEETEEEFGMVSATHTRVSGTNDSSSAGSTAMDQSAIDGNSRVINASVDDLAKSNLITPQITPQSSGSPPPSVNGNESTISLKNAAEMDRLSNLDSMKENLFIMERIVVQNVYHPKQYVYRGIDIKFGYGIQELSELMESNSLKITPNISRLWAYDCASTRGLAVTCLTWNKCNQDILAIGYNENNGKGKGLVCVWSVKNPEYPERIYKTNHAVMSVDFSENRPNLLAAGLFNGSIVLYNIQNIADICVLDSSDSTGKHSDPVWRVKWVRRDKGRSSDEREEEVLVSSSGDGRITQWTITKGFEFTDLMKVKRTLVKKQKEAPSKKSDALISRYSPALCFDFNSSDGNTYLVGTEDSFIHRCSCSYNEQFLETFTGHKGPVYKVAWSPFNDKIFLTCSADWSIRLWHVDKVEPVFVFQASIKAVVDIDWCPMSSTIFTAISEDQVEIWDLEDSILDPIIIHSPVNKTILTSVKFALNAEVLLVGDCDGYTTVYQLTDIISKESDEEEKKILKKIVLAAMPEIAMNY